jgi:S1-C subfamily serine protease
LTRYSFQVKVTHSRRSRYTAILAVVASLILAVGWIARPRDIPQSPPPVPSETELQELARRAQRRSLDSMTAYFAGLATDVRVSLAYVRFAGVSGIVWDEARVVTGPFPEGPQPESMTVRTVSGDRAATSMAASPRLPVSVLAVNGATGAVAARRAKSTPSVGDWIVAVWQTDQAPAFAAANFRESIATTCGVAAVHEVVPSVSLSRAMVGGGFFNMNGELLGVILPCGERIAAIEPSTVDDMLGRAGTVQERIVSRHGVLFSPLSDEERRYFKDVEGLLVRSVWRDMSATAAGLWPGDIAVALNGQPVAAIEDLQPLTVQSNLPLELRVKRGTRTVTLTLGSSSTPSVSSADTANVGLIFQSAAPTYRIDSVAPGSRAARAGVQSGDRLLRINRVVPQSAGQVERAMATATAVPMLLEIGRDSRRIAIVLP